MKDIEKYYIQSKKAMLGNTIFALLSIITAFIVWLIWRPDWWIYLLILFGGMFGFTGDLINIWYCKKKMKSHQVNE